jgi:ribosomal protein S18 acetylase RimI-like enzyme
VIRPAGKSDLNDVVRLIAEFRDWWGYSDPSDEAIHAVAERLMGDPAAEYLLAVDENEAVGVCQLRFRLSIWTGAEDCWLEDLFVSEAGRGHGLGRALVDAAVERATARGCKRIELDVNEQNEAALALYLGAGFTAEPKPPGRTLFISRRL